MVSNSGIDLMASGRDKGHQCAEAVALQSNPPGRLGQLDGGADCLRDIARASVAIIPPVKPQTLLPEEVWRDRDVSLGCQLVASSSNVGVNSKQFLENDHHGGG